MKIMIKLMAFWVITIIFTACSVPFDVKSSKIEIELVNTYGCYYEAEVTLPEDARREGVSFEDIILYYTIHKNDSFKADVQIYISSDQAADNTKNELDEKAIDVTLELDESTKDGTFSSEKLKTILNNKQLKFVIGGENLSLNPVSSIYIDLYVRIKGKYSLF